MKKAIAISILTALSGVAVVSAQPDKGAEHAECHGPGRGAHHFEKLDKNGDKVVTQAEMLSLMTEHFDKADVNRDGKVTPEERKSAFEKFAAERFAAEDKNKDGLLSPDELPPHFARKLDKLDENHDGKLSKEELAGVRHKHAAKFAKHFDADKTHTRAELSAHVSERFNKLDENRDGKLTEDELKRGRGFMHGRGRHGHHGAEHDEG